MTRIPEATKDEQLQKAMDLLERASEKLSEQPPDNTWWRDYFMLTGEHMICTEEGWQTGSCKQELISEYGDDHILDEVNKPQ
jgi:hypothetical protein